MDKILNPISIIKLIKTQSYTRHNSHNIRVLCTQPAAFCCNSLSVLLGIRWLAYSRTKTKKMPLKLANRVSQSFFSGWQWCWVTSTSTSQLVTCKPLFFLLMCPLHIHVEFLNTPSASFSLLLVSLIYGVLFNSRISIALNCSAPSPLGCMLSTLTGSHICNYTLQQIFNLRSPSSSLFLFHTYNSASFFSLLFLPLTLSYILGINI